MPFSFVYFTTELDYFPFSFVDFTTELDYFPFSFVVFTTELDYFPFSFVDFTTELDYFPFSFVYFTTELDYFPFSSVASTNCRFQLLRLSNDEEAQILLLSSVLNPLVPVLQELPQEVTDGLTDTLVRFWCAKSGPRQCQAFRAFLGMVKVFDMDFLEKLIFVSVMTLTMLLYKCQTTQRHSSFDVINILV